MTEHTKCCICGQEADCVECTFGTNDSSAKPALVTESMVVTFLKMCRLPICEACAREKGKAPTRAWVTLLISSLLFFPCVVGFSFAARQAGRSLPVYGVLMIILAVVSWFAQMIAGIMLVFKGGFGKGKMFLLVFAQFFPVFGGLVLLLVRGKINRSARAVNALSPVARERFALEDAKEAELKRQVESGEATDPELLREHKQNEEIKRAQQEKNTATVRRGNIGSALCGIAITVIVMLQGLEAYGSGRGYMQLFGSIELSSEMFALLIVGLLIFDVASLVSALRKR